MKALVTGLGGFVGAHLAARLVSEGWEVSGTIRPGGSQARLDRLALTSSVGVIEADLADPGAVMGAFGSVEVDIVFLLAASRSIATSTDRAATLSVNGASPAWIVDALSERCRTVLRLGSSTEYAQLDRPMDETTSLEPRGFFGATKAAGSLLLVAAAARREVRTVILRAFQVYGPFDHPSRFIPAAMRAAADGSQLPLTAPGRRRDWVFVDDVVECCLRAGLADELPPGQVLNVGTGRQTANEEIVAELERTTGHSIDVAVGAHGGRQWDASSWVCNPALARDLLGWEAKVDLADGLARCWASHQK